VSDLHARSEAQRVPGIHTFRLVLFYTPFRISDTLWKVC